MVSLPPWPNTTSTSLAASAPVIVTVSCRPATVTGPPALPLSVIALPAAPACTENRIRRAITGAAARDARQVDGDLRHVGAGKVV